MRASVFSIVAVVFLTGTHVVNSEACDTVMKLSELRDLIENQKQMIEALNQTIEGQSQLLQSLQANVAFTVRVLPSQAFPMNSIIKFDSVRTNIGGGYVSDSADPNYGKFIAPVNGTYHFSITVMNYVPEQNVAAVIVHNGEGRVSAQVQEGTMETGVNFWIAELKTEDKVWVVNPEGGSSTNLYKAYYTAFNGFLMHADV